MQRLTLRFPLKSVSYFITSPFFSKPVFRFGTVAAVHHQESVDKDPVSLILARLFKDGFRYRRGFAKVIGQEPEFKTLVSGLGSSEIDGLMERLLDEDFEAAVDFFHLLKNEYGVKHSRVSYLIVAHVLASKQRRRALKCHLLEMVQQEGRIPTSKFHLHLHFRLF